MTAPCGAFLFLKPPMADERSVGTVWLEEYEGGVVLHMRVGTGADLMLRMPPWPHKPKRNFARSLPWLRCSFQRVAKETTSSGKSWEGFIPQETKAHVAAQAEALVKTISDSRLSRALLAEVARFLHYPVMAPTARLAYMLKAVEDALLTAAGGLPSRGLPRP
jgi:hypothetical protein